MPYENVGSNLVRHAWVATKAGLSRPCLYCPVDDVPILLLKCFPSAPRNLLAELDRFSRLGVTEVCARKFALDERCVQDMGARMSYWRE